MKVQTQILFGKWKDGDWEAYMIVPQHEDFRRVILKDLGMELAAHERGLRMGWKIACEVEGRTHWTLKKVTSTI